MMLERWLLPALTLLAITNAHAETVSACTQAKEIRTRAQALANDNGLSGLAIAAGDAGGEKLRIIVGDWDSKAAAPVASAGKWLAAAAIMTLADDNALTLDEPVANWLPGVRHADQINLKQLLSHTSGVPPRSIFEKIGDDGVTASAMRVLEDDLLSKPGEAFSYGGSSFQVAAAVAEAASGKEWRAFFDEALAAPLELDSAQWGHPFEGADYPTPQIGGGLFISLDDYARFLEVVARGGESIFSQAAIDALLTDHRDGAAPAGVPAVIDEPFGYGLGVWCSKDENSNCAVAHSAGAFGTYPWLVKDTSVWGVVMMKGRFDKVFHNEQTLAELVTSCLGE